MTLQNEHFEFKRFSGEFSKAHHFAKILLMNKKQKKIKFGRKNPPKPVFWASKN